MNKEQLEFHSEPNEKKIDKLNKDIEKASNIQELEELLKDTDFEIATSKEDINENTIVYIGEWNIDVFNIVKQYLNLTHLYESFPDKKIFMQTLETNPDIDSSEKAEEALKNKNIYTANSVRSMLERTEFSEKQEEYSLVSFTVKQLGLSTGVIFDDIIKKAEELGLELCPAEVGPQLRLQYENKNNENEKWISIVMSPILDSNNHPRVFGLCWNNLQLAIDGVSVKSSHKWYEGINLVFQVRSFEK